MRKLLGTAALALTMMAPMAQAETTPIPDETWQEVREFLERNPEIQKQLAIAMERELGPDQVAQDKAFIQENYAGIYSDPMAPVLGNPEGTITLVKFTDFRCGYCKKVTPDLKTLMEKNPEVRLVIREFPILGQESTEAAKFALSVWKFGGAGAYEQVQEQLFNSPARLTGYYLEELAVNAGLDAREVIEYMDSPEIKAHLAKTREFAAGLKITGTPAILFGDVVVRGALPLEAMEKGLEEVFGQ